MILPLIPMLNSRRLKEVLLASQIPQLNQLGYPQPLFQLQEPPRFRSLCKESTLRYIDHLGFGQSLLPKDLNLIKPLMVFVVMAALQEEL